MTELVARLHSNGAGVRMRGMLERVTWPLRKLVWLVEEKVIWPIDDAIHRTPKPRRIRVRSSAATAELPSSSTEFPTAPSELQEAAKPGLPAAEFPSAPSEIPDFPAAPSELRREQAESASPAAPAAQAEPRLPRLRRPFRARLGSPVRDVSIVLGTVAVAIGVGVGVATFLGPSSNPDDNGAGRATASAAGASAAPASQAAGPTTLQGVAPEFNAASKTEASSAAGTTTESQAQVSPTAQTNAKPSSIPPGVAENIAAMNTARDFAGAFVLYEVGETNADVRKTFNRTATPALARALRDRPPRLPAAVEVPTAKVQNVVLGAEKGREVDASVSLLRLGDVSELRLTLTKRSGAWSVSEVRG